MTTRTHVADKRHTDLTHVGEDGTFKGYAVIWSETFGDGESIRRGAFSEESLASAKLLLHHKHDAPVGIWLAIVEDDHGLFVRGRLDMNTEVGRETASFMRSGALNGLSVCYVEKEKDGKVVTAADLIEISVVTFPAMSGATVDMKTVEIHDAVEVTGVHRTKDGYLSAFARAARSGIQVYRGSELGRPDLETVRVLRPDSEVFSEQSLRSYAHKPVTNDHPATPVTADNWRKFAVGQVGGEILRDKEFVRVPVMLMDRETVKDYEAGKKQLSLGYLADVEWKSGVHDGVEYDAVQRNIRANHLAVVAAARGGPHLVIGDDNKETEMTEKTLKQMVVDGVTIEMTDTATQVVEREFTRLRKSVADAEASGADRDKRIKELEDELEKLRESAKKTNDEQTVKIATLEKQVKDSDITPAKLDQMVKDRAGVIAKAKVLLGDKLVFTDKSLSDIRRQVVSHEMGDVAKDWNDEQVAISFDTITKKVQASDAVSDAIAGGLSVQDDRSKLNAAYVKRDQELSNAWKKVGTA